MVCKPPKAAQWVCDKRWPWVLLRASPPSELPTVVVTLMIKTTAPWDIGCKQLPHLMIEHTWLLAVGDAMNINELYFTFTVVSLGFHGDGVCEWSAWTIGGCLFSRQNGKLHSQKPRQEKQTASKVLMNTSRPWNKACAFPRFPVVAGRFMQCSLMFYSYLSCDRETFILVSGATVIPWQLSVHPQWFWAWSLHAKLQPLNPHLLPNVFFPHQSRHYLWFVTLWHLCVFVDKAEHTGMMGPPGNGTLVHNPEQYGEGMLWDPDWQAREAHVVLGSEWLWAGQKWLLHIGVLMSVTCLALGRYTCWSSKSSVDGMRILNYMDGVMVDVHHWARWQNHSLTTSWCLLKNVGACLSLSGRSMTSCLRVGGADGISHIYFMRQKDQRNFTNLVCLFLQVKWETRQAISTE